LKNQFLLGVQVEKSGLIGWKGWTIRSY